MRLTSTGLGIGTSSPYTKADIVGGKIQVSTAANLGFAGGGAFNAYTAAGARMYFYDDSNVATIGSLKVGGTNALTFSAGGTSEQLRLDSSGNLGLGVTPSAWGSGIKALQVGTGASLINAGNTGDIYIGQNYFFNGTNNIYINSYPSGQYSIASGVHAWFTAPSGTAGNAITFTQAMTLDASGNLLVGATPPPTANFRGFFNGSVASDIISVGVRNTDSSGISRLVLGNNTGTSRCSFGYTGSTSSLYAWGASTGYIGTEGTEPFIFITSGTERARITSGGEVYIAGTTDQGAYNLQCNGTGVWGAGAYVNGSDERLKDDIQSLDSCLNVVNALRP
ncbi:MAG: hypothetical protein EBR82_77270, partial [Caulobacteraceae bacterium]|nr:hypothetical protein [Caulobacteraceae bacterium]